MNVVLRVGGSEFEIELDELGDAGPVGDLVAALCPGPDRSVAIDGRTVGMTVPLQEAGLATGAIIDVASATDPTPRGQLTVLSGENAGRVFPLPTGTLAVGAAPADILIRGASGRIRLQTDSAGRTSLRNPEQVPVSVDGLRVTTPYADVPPGARLQIGGTELSFAGDSSEPRSRPGVFNRPPRPVARPDETKLDPPREPAEPAKAMRFGWGALIMPVVLGLSMAVLIHPRMAMFAIFSPAMLLANWFEDRRRARKERKELGEAYRDSLRRFAAEVAAAYERDTDSHHRHALLPAHLTVRARSGDSRLWERRPAHEDFMQLPVGTGCVPWRPELSGPASTEAAATLDQFGELHDVPILLRLAAGDVTGIAGSRPQLLQAARQLVLQAAVHHGPADLAISIFTEHPADWDWAKWLPHVVVDSSGRRRLAGDDVELAQVAALLPAADDERSGPLHLLVVDLPDLVSGARPALREALQAGAARGIAGVALAARPIDLPSLSTTIVSLEAGQARIRFPDGSGNLLNPWGLAASAARNTARSLARLQDPEANTSGAGLPTLTQLVTLLGLANGIEDVISGNWTRQTRRIAAPIGVTDRGPLDIDLVADGPHALLGGTTGAGKSELLRTLVASLAASVSPNSLNFVLVDYKGGSAFDACASLPHTVGLVTDLDDHLAARALTCLEAELRYREHRLRDAGVSDIEMYRAAPDDPLPRLLVVIDEFAALAKELPDFIEALVGIAQRGRSLGVHLLLATQRPNGVISDNIKANTNLRIALRVQDNTDSVDVIGCADAAAIGRGQPGRGFARLGPHDVTPFQTALVTSRSLAGNTVSLACRPFVFAHEQPAVSPAGSADDHAPTDLEQLVAAAVQTAQKQKLPTPRLPWPEALPSSLVIGSLPSLESGLVSTPFALADEPHRQRQVAAEWTAAAGNLLIYGLPGSGTTTTLATLTLGLAANNLPDDLHIYVFDFDDQMLMPLVRLPHVGAVVGVNDRERQLRLLRRLSDELQRRRHRVATEPQAGPDPIIVTLLDNYGGFADSFDEPGDMAVRNLFTRLVADGPGVGMFTIATAKHPGDIPTRLASLVGAKLAFRLADRYDYTSLGVPAVDPPSIPGRAFESGSGRELQVAVGHHDGVAAAIEARSWVSGRRSPWSIDVLPSDVTVADVIGAGHISAEEWFLPLGIGDTALSPAGLLLRDGEHALITGPARSGKSTALATIAAVARAADPSLRISAIVPRRSPLADCAVIDDVVDPNNLGGLDGLEGSQLLLVDDAELVEDNVFLADLVKARHRDVRVVAAGSADAIRSLYGHWTQDIRRSRIGFALRPNVAADGDLWQTQLPRRGPERFPAGRGYLLADGQTELVQLGRK